MRPPRLPLHRRLTTRLLTTSILIAICATLSTAWLVARTATSAVRQEQGRSLGEEKSVYDLLLGYAATHRSWSDVEPVLREQSARLDRRITLIGEDQRLIADSGPGPSLRTARAAATIDPLHVDAALTDGTDRIDPRAVGPYALPPLERLQLRTTADAEVACMRKQGFDATVDVTPSGRPVVRLLSADAKNETAGCRTDHGLGFATRSEQQLLTVLERQTRKCLGARGEEFVAIQPDFTVYAVLPGASSEQISDCVDRARRAQLRPYVAPPAQMFVTDSDTGAAQPAFNLSRGNLATITLGTAAVLLVAVGATVLAGRRLVQPLHALTEAARQPVDRQSPVAVSTRDEVGYLAAAFNDLSERRRQVEEQRRQLVADVAHELRTPLTVIRSRVEAAQDGLTPLGPALLGVILGEAKLLQHVIDDLRDLAAADADTLRLHPEPVWIADNLEQVVEAHRATAEQAGVTLRQDTAGAELVLVLDPVRLRQLAGNLVTNAIRHTRPGGSVTISTRLADEALTITVADTGVGIAPDDLPRVFDRFWRADASRSRSTGGTGLGLPIARKLAEAHGGTITIESRLGHGTELTVTLPAHLPANGS
ncbi:HAMP domain-containing sensor histidine kinase [Actinoplanes sp. NPDC089786]|uniref:HAMP domain-containing sensor histidine kinase n=1 Tax=Actinoplanes sp. NPDC089786 TaxID=3155185 RepID=UPI00342E622D